MTAPLGTLSELRAQLDAGAVSSRELVDASLARVDALDSVLHAFLGLRAAAVRAEAGEADARRARGERRSAIDGIPMALKDNLVQRGEPTSCASRIGVARGTGCAVGSTSRVSSEEICAT